MANPQVMERLYTLSMQAAKDPSWERISARLEWLMADATPGQRRPRPHPAADLPAAGLAAACKANMALQDLETRRRNMLTDDDLRSVQAPALVIWTTKDPSGPVDEGRRIAELIPQGRLAVIENAGHWPQYEQAEIFNKVHLEFLLEGRT